MNAVSIAKFSKKPYSSKIDETVQSYSAESLSAFRQRLITYLFAKSFS